MADLVPNRECGKCRACCEAPLIDDPELSKLPGDLCPNWRVRRGCAIYETRPSTCRHWFCGWRMLDNLGEEWRPDKSGIMIVPYSTTVPVRLEQGMQFDLIRGLDRIYWEPFVTAISLLIQSGFPVSIAVPREHGCHPLMAPLNANPDLKAAIARNDYGAITEALMAAAKTCLERPPVEVVFKKRKETTAV